MYMESKPFGRAEAYTARVVRRVLESYGYLCFIRPDNEFDAEKEPTCHTYIKDTISVSVYYDDSYPEPLEREITILDNAYGIDRLHMRYMATTTTNNDLYGVCSISVPKILKLAKAPPDRAHMLAENMVTEMALEAL